MGSDRADFSDDAVLVAALRAGDEAAFGWLLDRHDGPLRRLARTFVASPAVADEVVQDTWLAVIEGIDRFEQRSSLKTWITRILMNKARTSGVRDKRSVPFSAAAPAAEAFPAERFLPADHPRWPGHWAAPPPAWEELPAERLEARETLDRVRAAIDALPPLHRQVITLRDLDGWTSDEICAALDLTPANQRVVLHRARARVRTALEEYLTGAPA
ncbi:MAG TPA: RNA polymerase sigma factor [Acidimicrobiales bacterium]|nr:RNA polymerase sigma factor [Acidimicrobiales bacterium]